MNRFWNHYILPIMETVQPRHLIEIGADRGWNTQHILAYCRRTGSRLDIIDPAPQPNLHAILASYGQEYSYHALKSVEAIPMLQTPDIALIDGDHNWATVYREFELLYAQAERQGSAPPITLSHDVAWPYARRDMYYSPQDFSDHQRHPYAYVGMLPGVSELVENGMNGVLANATHEGGPRNGVLTAIEDFIASTPIPVHFYKLPFHNGLGIVVPEARMTDALRALLESFYTRDALLEACTEIDLDSMRVRAMLTEIETKLIRRSEALHRARALLIQKNAEISSLRVALAESNQAHSPVDFAGHD